MKWEPRTALWMGSGFGGALVLAASTLLIEGAGPSGTIEGLRLTARFSYGLFWLTYVGGALMILLGPAFNAVARRARELGLSFAAAQLVHVGLVVWLAWISPPQPVRDAVMPFFAIGVVWTYLLASLSMEGARDFLGPDMLRVLRTIGSEYIALTFFTDFVLIPAYPPPHPTLYIPFWLMLLIGPLLRLTAAIKERQVMRVAGIAR
jgi:succinate-acetate transporter protein